MTFTSFVKASAQVASDFQTLLGIKQASFGCCCLGNPTLEHLHTAADLSARASHQFARAAAITVDQNVKVSVRAAEQRAIDGFSLIKDAEVKILANDVAKN